MKMSDPFGRMERRHQAGYEAMRDALSSANINTPDKAREIMQQSKSRAVKFIFLFSIVLIAVGSFFPDGIAIALAVAIFLMVWVISSTVNGHRYIRR